MAGDNDATDIRVTPNGNEADVDNDWASKAEGDPASRHCSAHVQGQGRAMVSGDIPGHLKIRYI
ncbi:hypothetical protein BKA56DRAFT_594436 [Ilyonectria sp. MPI-CAGE-AT-0026]|nr:hypothetical protein BKA56DRAFT_594436 [Ilyonectria sp. MPI-CAGE-AT-0026]